MDVAAHSRLCSDTCAALALTDSSPRSSLPNQEHINALNEHIQPATFLRSAAIALAAQVDFPHLAHAHSLNN